MAAQRCDQADARKAGVSHHDQAAVRQPALRLQDGLARPIDHGLVPPVPLAAPALGGGENSQERQRPAPAGPGDRHHDHERQPAQATRPDEVPARRAHRVAVEPARLDLEAPAALNRVVDAEYHLARGQESVEHPNQEYARHRAAVPARPVQHLVVAREARVRRQAHDPQRLGHSSLARREHGPGYQHEDAAPDRRRETGAEGRQPAREHGRRQAWMPGGAAGTGAMGRHRIPTRLPCSPATRDHQRVSAEPLKCGKSS